MSASTFRPFVRGTQVGTAVASGSVLYYGIAGSANVDLDNNGTDTFIGTLDNVLLLPWPNQQIGGISSLAALPLTTLEIAAASSLGWVAGDLDANTTLTLITIDAWNITSGNMDEFFASLVVSNAAAARVGTVTMTNVPAPGAAGTASIATLAGAGWTISVPS